MTGLEKMKLEIIDEAKNIAEIKMTQAEKEAQETINAAKADAEKIAEEISRKSQKEVSVYNERVASSVDLQKRTELLKAKQEIIAQVIEKAYDKVKNLNTKEYFELMLKVLDKYVLSEEGEIIFSKYDLERMTQDTKNSIVKLAQNKGGKLVISDKENNIENGFVLIYGGVEENCTLRALFDAKKDEMSDIINKIMFS